MKFLSPYPSKSVDQQSVYLLSTGDNVHLADIISLNDKRSISTEPKEKITKTPKRKDTTRRLNLFSRSNSLPNISIDKPRPSFFENNLNMDYSSNSLKVVVVVLKMMKPN